MNYEFKELIFIDFVVNKVCLLFLFKLKKMIHLLYLQKFYFMDFQKMDV